MKHIFPYGDTIISIVQAIPWTTFRWEGTLPLWTETTPPEKREEDERVFEKMDVGIIATTEDNFYYNYFGGTVYEILNNQPEVKAIVNLRDYVDPTGDIDVKIRMPRIIFVKPVENDFLNYFYTENAPTKTNMNDLLQDYTKWIFLNMKAQIEKIPEQIFNQIFADAAHFENDEDSELVHADLIFERNNVKLLRTHLFKMIKIQLSVKFEKAHKPEHLLEFVLPLFISPGDAEVLKNPNFDDIMKIREYPVEKFNKLIEGNIDALKERIAIINNAKLSHKAYNHIGRLRFLNKIAPLFVPVVDPKKPNTPEYKELYKLTSSVSKVMAFLLDANESLCKFDYNKSRLCRDIIKQIVYNMKEAIKINGKYLTELRIQVVGRDGKKSTIGISEAEKRLIGIEPNHTGGKTRRNKKN